VNAWVTLDLVCKRYGILPSQALKLGTTVDIRCAIVAIEYENYLNSKVKDGNKPSSNLSQEQLVAMMNNVRNQN
jgi:hypothetical protein